MSLRSSDKDSHAQLPLLKPLERTYLEDIVLKNLGFQVNVASNQSAARLSMQTIHVEVMRCAIWMHSSEGRYAVPIHRVLHAAQCLMQALWDSRSLGNSVVTSTGMFSSRLASKEATHTSLDTELYKRHSSALNELEMIGDIAEWPVGSWLPAPLRIVAFPAVQRWMLIGGRPTHCLPRNIQLAIKHDNLVRFLASDPKDLGLTSLIQSQASWCNTPQQSLREWIQRVLNECQLVSYKPGESSYEFYVPHGARQRRQDSCWRSSPQSLVKGRYLIRCRSNMGIHYRIAEVQQGKIIALSQLSLSGRDHRRLRYGFDALAQSSIKVGIQSLNNIYQFQLENELPEPEHRLFSALGHLQWGSSDNYYPRKWDIPSAYAQRVKEVLELLEIRM